MSTLECETPPARQLLAGQVHWRVADDGGLACAVIEGEGGSICGSSVCLERATLDRPKFGSVARACPTCVGKLHQSLPQSEFNLLPMEVLGDAITVRATHTCEACSLKDRQPWATSFR